MKFNVKRRWWTCALFILFNILAILSVFSGIYLLFVIVFAADLFILRDASHIRYIINDKFIIIKRIFYSDIEIPLISITEINNYYLMANQGFGTGIIEHVFGGYRIVYNLSRRKNKTVIISPKDPEKFIAELYSHADKNVNLINSTESAFKRKKDSL